MEEKNNIFEGKWLNNYNYIIKFHSLIIGGWVVAAFLILFVLPMTEIYGSIIDSMPYKIIFYLVLYLMPIMLIISVIIFFLVEPIKIKISNESISLKSMTKVETFYYEDVSAIYTFNIQFDTIHVVVMKNLEGFQLQKINKSNADIIYNKLKKLGIEEIYGLPPRREIKWLS
jgi:hypothetical protein